MAFRRRSRRGARRSYGRKRRGFVGRTRSRRRRGRGSRRISGITVSRGGIRL